MQTIKLKPPVGMEHLDLNNPVNRLRGGLRVTARGRFNEKPAFLPEKYLHTAVAIAKQRSGSVRPIASRSCFRKSFTEDPKNQGFLFWYDLDNESSGVVTVMKRGDD